MTDVTNLAVYSLAAGLATIVGVYLVRHFSAWTQRNYTPVISFAVGVIMANAFFNLLPEGARLTETWIYSGLAGFLFLYLLELAISVRYVGHEDPSHRPVGVVSAFGIGLHSLLDGFTIGVGFEVSYGLGVVTAFAVVLHELPEGVFTFTLLKHDRVPEQRALAYSWLVALATPFGAILTHFFVTGISSDLLGLLLAFAGGSFLYIGAADLVPETHRRSNFVNAVLVLSGTVLVLMLSFIID